MSYTNSQIASDSYEYFVELSIASDGCGDISKYYFTSIHLNNLNSPKEIWARGKSLFSLYKGYRILFYNPYEVFSDLTAIRLTSLYEANNLFNPLPNHNKIIQSYPFCNIESKKSRDYKTIFSTSIKNEDLLNILLQLGNGIDWINLYSVLDTIKFYTKKKKIAFKRILELAGYDENDIKKFTGTANNFGLLGVDARHGKTTWTIPKETIVLEKSQIMLLGICRAYITEVHNIEFIFPKYNDDDSSLSFENMW